MAPITPLLDLAHRQHRLARLDQLRELGFSHDAVVHLVDTDRLWRVHVGVYALPGPLTPLGWTLAAVFRCQPDAYARRFSGAALLGLRTHWPQLPEVVVGRDWAPEVPGILASRSRTLGGDVGICHGIPTTSPARTIRDCAPSLDAEQLKSLLRRAEHDGLDLTTLTRPGNPANLKAALDRYVIGSGLTANELEARFYELCASAGLPRPEIQARLTGRRRIDFVWRDIGLIVETDGRRSHDSHIAFTDDRTRDRHHFLTTGFVTLRFTWFEVEHEPELVAAQLIAAHARLHGHGAAR